MTMKIMTIRAPDLRMMKVKMVMRMEMIVVRQEQSKRVNKRTCASDGRSALT